MNELNASIQNGLLGTEGSANSNMNSIFANTANSSEFNPILIKRRNQENLQKQQIQQEINRSGNSKKELTAANAANSVNQLKQFQYQQHLINQQHLKQIKLQQQQQQKHHLIYQQQQQQTQLNILNHNQNVAQHLATAAVTSGKVSKPSMSVVAPSNATTTPSTSSTTTSTTATVDGGHNLVLIENEIQKTYNFYVQMLKERKDYLTKELNTIINYAILNNQTNINKQLKLQYQLEMKKQQLEQDTEQELNELKVLLKIPYLLTNTKS